MKDEMFNELLVSVEQAGEIMRGNLAPGRRTEYSEPQVKSIRTKTGLSQHRFASLLGVSTRTLENWEQGRRQPSGAARALLKLVEADPDYALKTLQSELL